MSRVKILQVLPTLSRSGTEMFVLNNFRAMDRSRYKFIVLALSSEYTDLELEIKELGGDVVYCDLSFGRIKHLVGNIIRLSRILKGIDYDILHCHESSQCGAVFLASLLAGKKKNVAHSHFSVYEAPTGGLMRRFIYGKFLPYLTNRLGDVSCACSVESAKALYGPRIHPVIVNNAIDVGRYMNPDVDEINNLRRELCIPEGTKVYGNLSRYANPKNITFVVDVFNEIHKKEPSSILILAGKKGDLYECTVEKVLLYSLQDCVRLLGQRNDVNLLLKLIDCMIFPSLNEGFPYQIVEAQAAQTPIVVSDSITKSVDVGLGLVSYVSLNESAEEWSGEVMTREKPEINSEVILKAFDDHGLDIQTSARQLERIYSSIL